MKAFELIHDIFSDRLQWFLKKSASCFGQSVVLDVVHCATTGSNGVGVKVLSIGVYWLGYRGLALSLTAPSREHLAGQLKEGINCLTPRGIRVWIKLLNHIKAGINKGISRMWGYMKADVL